MKLTLSDKEILKRELARRNLYDFMKYKFEYYYANPFLDNWHYGYLCEILGELLKGNIANLLISMPPSYGKSELIARTFIPFALGHNPALKFIYASYGDELSKSISVETRDFFKSNVFSQLFGKQKLIMDKAEHWFNEKGGGLFATTTGGAITGKHCHIGIADDLLKASEAYSEAARKNSIIYFTESFLSRLLATDNINGHMIVIMQRLHKKDLSGYLKEVAKNEWLDVSLEAINKAKRVYEIGKFKYVREANTALFEKRHNLAQLESIKKTMGEYAFNAQYQQEPENASGGFFDINYFDSNLISDFDVPKQKEYIFIDPAESTKDGSDNRAIVCVGISQKDYDAPLIIVMDCFYGKWNNDTFIEQSFEMMSKYPSAEVRIEPKGGGITLTQTLQKQILSFNLERRNKGEMPLTNLILNFKVPQSLSKQEKIATLLPAYNQGNLKFRRNGVGINQIRAELMKYNPDRKNNDDNCIDALSGITWQKDIYPLTTNKKPKVTQNNAFYLPTAQWRI